MKSLAIQIRGVSYKPVDLHDTLDASSVILLRANNIDDGKINFDEVVFVDKKKVSQEQLLQKGDVLICASSGSKYLVGKAATVDFDREVTFGAFCKVVRPRNQEDADYISMYFQSPIYRREISSVAIGANINNIRNEHIDALSVRWPSAEKRQDSSSILRKVDLIIRRRKLELQVFDKLIKARFVEMFGDLKLNPYGWELRSFEDMSELITDGEHATPRRVSKGIYLLSARNVLNHSLQLNDVDYIDQEEYDRIAKRIIPREGDVLISCSGTVGRCCSVPCGLKFQMVRSAALIRFKDCLNPVFVEYMITSDFLQDQINSSKTASSQANLFQGKIAKLKGFVPPIELQIQFVDFVKQVDKSKSLTAL